MKEVGKSGAQINQPLENKNQITTPTKIMKKITYTHLACALAGGLCAIAQSATAAPQETARPAQILHEYTLPPFSLEYFGYTAEELAIAQGHGAVTDRPAIGSGLQRLNGNHYISVTDRGPTYDRSTPTGSKAFPLPQFNPMIVLSQMIGDQIVPRDYLPLLNDLNQPVTGLPNGPLDDAPGYLTVTAPVGQAFPPNENGLDIEDVHTLPGGGFILVEEYGPSVVIVSSTGHVLKRYTPGGKTWPNANYSVSDILPPVLKQRRANRGLESIAVSPDGRTAYTVMQSPLGVTTVGSLTRESRLIRILRLDISDPLNMQVTGQFVYFLQPVADYPFGNFARDLKISAAAWVSEDRLLILERTDKVGAGGINQGGAKLILLDLTGATDVKDPAEFPAAAAVPVELEKVTTVLATLGITPASARVVLDVNQELPSITDFKLEGLTILNDNQVSISNDNDFGIGDSPGRATKVYTIRLSQPLR